MQGLESLKLRETENSSNNLHGKLSNYKVRKFLRGICSSIFNGCVIINEPNRLVIYCTPESCLPLSAMRK